MDARFGVFAEIVCALSLIFMAAPSVFSADPNYPEIKLKNEILKLSIYLPDAEKGYYRSIRFDWSGMIRQAEYKGNTFFGELKKPHNPQVHDHGSGPCEEFGMNIPVNFDDVAEGEAFLKIGVGLLEKHSGKKGKYWFPTPYKVIKLFPWETVLGEKSVKFTQKGECPGGWAYHYEKTVSVDDSKPVLTISRKLKNTGEKIIECDHYSHNMIIINDQPIGGGYMLSVPFAPNYRESDKVEWIDGNLAFTQAILPGAYWTRLEGFSKPEHNGFTISLEKLSISAQTNLTPSDYCIYAEKTALCPEPFVLIRLAPGQSLEWETSFTFAESKK